MRFVSIVGGFIALLLLKDPLSAAGDSAPQFIGMWGSYGSGPGQFNYPYGIALSLDGNVYVSDQYNYRIAAFTADGSLVTSWGSQGHNDGQFYGTIGLAVDASGRVFVADNGNNRVQVFEGNGAFVRQWYARGARDISLGPDGLVYVADFDYSGRSLIEVFTSEGAPVRAWGSGTFGSIASITFNAVGELYVADEGGFFYSVPQSISRWTPLGVLLNRWGTAGSAVGQLGGAAGIAVDGLGRVYVAEHQTNRVDVFGSDGTFLASWGTLEAVS